VYAVLNLFFPFSILFNEIYIYLSGNFPNNEHETNVYEVPKIPHRELIPKIGQSDTCIGERIPLKTFKSHTESPATMENDDSMIFVLFGLKLFSFY